MWCGQQGKRKTFHLLSRAMECRKVPANSICFAVGSISISSTGPITTNGSGARGIVADSGDGPVTVTASGAITTQGSESHGIWATSTTTGTVQVNAPNNVSTTGQFSTGINAHRQAVDRDDQYPAGRIGDGRLAGGAYWRRAAPSVYRPPALS